MILRHIQALENRLNTLITRQQFNGRTSNEEFVTSIFNKFPVVKNRAKEIFKVIGKPPNDKFSRCEYLKKFFEFGIESKSGIDCLVLTDSDGQQFIDDSTKPESMNIHELGEEQ